jgi:hypothetical protein
MASSKETKARGRKKNAPQTETKGRTALPREYLEGRKAEWRKQRLSTEQVNFLAELLVTSNLVSAWRASRTERESADWATARRGANKLILELNRSQPGLVESVLAEANAAARQKVQWDLNARLDVEDDEERLAAVTVNLRRFQAENAPVDPGADDRDDRPVVSVTLNDRLAAYFARQRG